VRVGRERTEPAPHLVARTATIGMVFQQPDCVADFSNDVVRGAAARDLRVIVPDVSEVAD